MSSKAAVSGRFQRFRGYAQTVPEGWFKPGRNPWRDFYTPDAIENLGKIVGVTDENKLEELGFRLCHLAERYLDLEEQVDFEHTFGERVDWVDENLITPLRRVQRALGVSNHKFVSRWPDDDLEAGYSKMLRWRCEIDRVLRWAIARRTWIKRQRDSKPTSKPETDRKYALAYDLVCVFEDLTGRLPSRVTYTEDTSPIRLQAGRTRKHLQRGHKARSKGEDFISSAAMPILGRFDNLSHQIQTAIAKRKTMKKSV